MDEHRRVMRVSLPEPLAGFADDEPVYVVDASMSGVRLSHRTLFSPRTDLHISFDFDGREVGVVGSVRWTRLQRPGSAASARSVYQSGVEIVSIRQDSESVLRGLVEHQVDRALDERNARHELINGVWRKIVTVDKTQPLNGFTVAASEAKDQIEILRCAYEIADPQMKRIIQRVAELTISTDEVIPMRRYTP